MDQQWIDLNSPTKEEIDSLILTENLDPIIAKDLLLPTPTQYTETRDNMIYTVLHLPSIKQPNALSDVKEIDFVITPNSLITTRYDSIDALHYFAKQVEVSEILNRGENIHLFFGIIREIYKSVIDELAYMHDWLEEIEKNIFEGQEKAMVFSISSASRNLLNFKKILDPHGAVFDSLKEISEEKFGKNFQNQMKTLIEEWRRIIKTINNQLELTAELRETNNAMLSTKQNETMKVLTIMAFVTFPLSLIAAIFGMNTNYLPIVGSQFDFWIVMGIMSMLSIIMFIFFKYKDWI
ncbi:MAG: CorA family divalent cation transporter [Candidatus Zambryskibacteria bacterium]|nr:CorA family divalent cation transporter [Candidatus Zambryskibacteria bacterium]